MMNLNNIQFNDQGLVPCIVQDAATLKVLMLGYMNQESIDKTLRDKKVTFYSRSKQRLWTKGETSGNFLNLIDATLDCDNDTILIKAIPTGPVCHTGADTCFNEVNGTFTIHSLEEIIADRKKNPKKESYTNRLFESGINKIAQKVGEEAVELVIESKDENDNLFLNEASDLIFHFLVLLQAKGVRLSDVEAVLQARHKQ